MGPCKPGAAKWADAGSQSGLESGGGKGISARLRPRDRSGRKNRPSAIVWPARTRFLRSGPAIYEAGIRASEHRRATEGSRARQRRPGESEQDPAEWNDHADYFLDAR